ncbi:hypothetical protein ACIFOC_00431 [Leucobacter aridicollis]
MMAKAWARIVLVLRIATLVFAGLVTLGLFLSAQKIIEINSGWEKWVWGTTLVVIVVDNVGTLFTRRHFRIKHQREKDIENTLMSTLLAISRTKRVRFEELGMSVYVPRRFNWKFWQSRSRPRMLKRIHRFRPSGFPQQSGIAWTELTGAVGECWRDRKLVYWDGVAIARRHSPEALSEMTQQAYESISTETKQGFSLEQFKSITGKYSEVAATPIWDNRLERKLIGILTIDRAYVNGHDYTKRALTNTAIRENLQIASKQLGTQLRSKEEG